MKQPNKTCLWCGKEFYRPPCLARIKYCCDRCYRLARRGTKLSEEVKQKISEGVKKNLPSTAIKKGQRLSPATEFQQMDDHFKWKGGNASYRKIFILNNKDFKCEECGRTDKIHIHHIDKNRKNNDISNLKALCCTCHYKAHRSFNHIRRCECCNKEFETYKRTQRFCSIVCGRRGKQ